MSIIEKILPPREQREIKLLRQVYNRALDEKWQLETHLNHMEIGSAGRAKLIIEIVKLQDIIIAADQRIFLILFYRHQKNINHI